MTLLNDQSRALSSRRENSGGPPVYEPRGSTDDTEPQESPTAGGTASGEETQQPRRISAREARLRLVALFKGSVQPAVEEVARVGKTRRS